MNWIILNLLLRHHRKLFNGSGSLVRSSEEAALKQMTLLPDDTGHHIVQSRTGGDALTELPI